MHIQCSISFPELIHLQIRKQFDHWKCKEVIICGPICIFMQKHSVMQVTVGLRVDSTTTNALYKIIMLQWDRRK